MLWVKGSLLYSQATLLSISSWELCGSRSLPMCLFKPKNWQGRWEGRQCLVLGWHRRAGRAQGSALLRAHPGEMLGDSDLLWASLSGKQTSCSRAGTEFRTFLCWANCSVLKLHLSDSSAAGAQRTQMLLKLANIYTSNFFFNFIYPFQYLLVSDCCLELHLCLDVLLFYFQMSFSQGSAILAK